MRAGCRCKNMVFVCFCLFFVTLRGRRTVHSRVTYFEQVLCRGLWVDFDIVYNFFRIDCPFRSDKQFLFLLLGGAISFAKLRSIILKSPKIGGKVCAHNFV